ncbi:hypothetical protein GCM10023331_21860 [Algivirga pacifica]|uniref:RHS repeat-associated core domain-containing protein n=1 Tax=Algivirga pacifica TaxID=1162670 RepID=A0ABP9DEJ3_9BACT
MDYGARNYDASVGRWFGVDPLAEMYYANSPYSYVLNQPTNAIDPDGKLVIFINGNHFGDGGKSNYWRTYKNVRHGYLGAQRSYSYRKKQVGVGFDQAVMNHFNDYNSIYKDGALGGYAPFNINNSLSPSSRENTGFLAGLKEAETIINNLKRDKNGAIIEAIRIISHSMGGAYAKGYIKALLAYIKQHDIVGVNIYEYDFAPFQPTEQTAVDGIPTIQYSHSKDILAGNKPIKGAAQADTSSDESQGHSIHDFFNQIQNLPEGEYQVVNGKIVPKN